MHECVQFPDANGCGGDSYILLGSYINNNRSSKYTATTDFK